MKIPITWLKDFVDIDLPLEELAAKMTMAGLEVEEIHLVGLCVPEGQPHEFKITGLAWSADKFVVAQIDEVMAPRSLPCLPAHLTYSNTKVPVRCRHPLRWLMPARVHDYTMVTNPARC